ncbi:hypothetical protein PVAP13_7KG120490 [Panicum virgatum]|uniref:Uncharacterized protein n=1 Tax=Panicum virgatum TaxID=38727 RepID=A0A8T0QAB5_PANVG|nr:hypothetical protein PVAP13_7KG120490 [Panicum virgatum]
MANGQHIRNCRRWSISLWTSRILVENQQDPHATPPPSPAAIRGVSYHCLFGPSKSSRVVVLASGQFHRRRDPHACCYSLTGDGCVICESHGHRARRSCGAAEERIGKGSGRWGLGRTTTDGEEQQAAIGSEIASDWVGAARAGWRCLLAHLSMMDNYQKSKYCRNSSLFRNR